MNKEAIYHCLRHVAAFICMLCVVILFSYERYFDFWISDLFYNNGTWLWPKHDTTLKFWLHDIYKYIFIIIGVFCIAITGASYRVERLAVYRHGAVLVAIALIILPILVGYLKSVTGIFCPSKLVRYGGTIPDLYRSIDLDAGALKRARCYPAAHPSPGFAFLALGFAGATYYKKVIGFTIGIILGVALTVIQIGRGEHFISHGIATAVIALWFSYTCSDLVSYILLKIERKYG